MQRTNRRGVLRGWVFGLAVLAATPLMTGCGDEDPESAQRPIVFIHGFMGSATQFQSQAMRFVINGYPSSHLAAVERDTLAPVEAAFPALDARIDTLLAETGADAVDVVAHSQGTSKMIAYLADPQRAARVARYVNLDGSGGEDAPEGIPTLAIWDWRDRGPMHGAENLTMEGQGHVELATSPETFAEMFEFLTGSPPETTEVTPEPDGTPIELSGRAVDFPANAGVEGATVRVYEVDSAGTRQGDPVAVFEDLDAEGTWGPFEGRAGARYEFVLEREGALPHHHFMESFVRSDPFVRLLTQPPDSGLLTFDQHESHTNLSILRDKEFWGDGPDESDDLTIDGDPIVDATLFPREEGTVAVFVFDAGSDGESDRSAQVEPISGTPFIVGIDLAMEASAGSPPDETVAVELTGRATAGETRTLHIPRWPSDQRLLTVRFHDFAP